MSGEHTSHKIKRDKIRAQLISLFLIRTVKLYTLDANAQKASSISMQQKLANTCLSFLILR
jgi:hypothetical protein